jgi:FdhE protein
MQRTNAGVRRDAGHSRLEELADQHKEWRPWLSLLELLDAELQTARWHAAANRLFVAADADVPLLQAAVIPVSRGVAKSWLRRLLRAAAANPSGGAALGHAHDVDALALLAAAIAHDYRRPPQLATIPDDHVPALAATLSVAVMPLLHACAAALADRVPASWPHGHCPVCGAWPVLTEVRGLERARVLRCARCATGWQTNVLLCPFCGERDHNGLGSLIPEGDNPVQHVEVCRSCNAYTKVITVLRGIPAAQLVLEDLATVELDLVAMQRGHTRPADPGYPVWVDLVEDARGVRSFFGVSS